MKYDQVVGMLQAHEMRQNKKMSTKGKSIALVFKQKTPQTSDFEDQVGLIVRKYFKKMERGYGHLKSDCVNKQRRVEKSYITFSESDSDKDESDVEDMINMVAYLGIFDEGNGLDSEEESGLSVEDENQILVESLLKFQEENKCLREKLAKIQEEQQAVIKERDEAIGVGKQLKTYLDEEAEKNKLLTNQLNEQLRNIKMLTNGTKDLEKVLNIGRTNNTKWGLGFRGRSSQNGYVKTQFVKVAPIQPHRRETTQR
ncbi:unnamed protein product [Cochlearia groenlandica]